MTQTAVQLLSILGTVVLARLLEPEDFGIIALAVSLAGFLSLFASLGVSVNLLRRTSGVEEAAATYYWAVLGASAVLAGVLIGAGPHLAALVGQPQSGPAVQVLAVCLPPALLVAVVQSILRWRLDWRGYNLTVWLPAACLVLIEVVLAGVGFGYWAVVVGMVASSWLGLVAGHVVARWRPGFTFRASDIRQDLGMTGSLWSQQVLTFLQGNADYWAVSRFLGASPLGVYYVAFVLPSVIRQRLTAVSQSTLLAVLSRCSDDAETFRQIWVRTTVLQLFIGTPTLVGLAAVSEPVIRFFFGEQWSGAAAVVPWICLSALVELYLASTTTAALVRGLATRSLMVSLLRTTATVLAVFVAAWLWRDLEAVAIGVLAGAVGAVIAQDVLLARPLGLGWRPLRSDLLRIVALSVAMYASVRIVVSMTEEWVAVAGLSLAVFTGVVVYGGLALVFARATAVWAWRQARMMLS